MAINSIIRRVSSSKIVPLAIRVAGGSQRYHHHCAAVLTAVNRTSGLCSRSFLKRSFPSYFHRYSTQLGQDDALVHILNEEIESAKGTENLQDEVPEGFPFKIEDTPGQNTIMLSREYQGESIVVEVDMPSLVTGEEEDEDDDNNDQDIAELANSSQLPMVVRVTRKKGPILEFTCTAYPDEISIDGLSLKDPNVSEDQLPYEGPDFADLDENLQKAFKKYLEIRGIKPSATNFLHEYMVNKDSREYLLWLEKIKNFVQA